MGEEVKNAVEEAHDLTPETGMRLAAPFAERLAGGGVRRILFAGIVRFAGRGQNFLPGIGIDLAVEFRGGGIGLYAVRMRVNSLGGKVVVMDSEFAPLGATIHIELPFKR